MTRKPDFDELVGGDLPQDERQRLRAVHDLLVAAGPPPDLSPELAEPVPPAETVSVWQRRRWGVLALAAAFIGAAFLGGYLFGNSRANDADVGLSVASETVRLRGTALADGAAAVVRVGRRDGSGNLPMVLTVEGLRELPRGDYYRLALTKRGKVVVTCGTFNSRGRAARTTVRFAAAYEIEDFDGWVVTEYKHGRKAEPIVLST